MRCSSTALCRVGVSGSRISRRSAPFAALAVVELDAGHAVNIEDAAGFNAAVTRFFADAEKR